MKELIAALAVLADPNASPDDKAAALDKLTAYFNSQLDAEEAKTAEAAAAAAATSATADDTTATTSEAGKGVAEEPSKEMASALATIDALTARISKIEKASAVGSATRAPKPTILPRVDAKPPMSAQETVTIDMIDRAAQNTIRMTGK